MIAAAIFIFHPVIEGGLRYFECRTSTPWERVMVIKKKSALKLDDSKVSASTFNRQV